MYRPQTTSFVHTQEKNIKNSYISPDGKNYFENWKPDLPKHNSGSYYQNRKIFFYIPVPVNPEQGFEIPVTD